MLVENLRRSHTDTGRVRVACDLRFEQQSREFPELYFEVPEGQAEGFDVSAEGFVLAVLVVASFLGEERVRVDQPLCADLAMNLYKWQQLYQKWYGDKARPIEVESAAGIALAPGNTASGSAIFLSGGIDSFSALQDNLARYPRGDSRRITFAYFVYGLDVGDPNRIAREDIFERSAERLRQVLTPEGVALVPIYTNVREIGSDWHMYEERQFGSLLAAMAHFFAGRCSTTTIALDLPVSGYPGGWGSHPWAYLYLNSAPMAIHSDGDQYGRLQKVQNLAAWPAVFSAVRVCWMMPDIAPDQVNCGRCRKCLFTKLEMLVAGTLADSTCFPDTDIDRDALRAALMQTTSFWEELVTPLRAMGEPELAAIVQDKIDRRQVRDPGTAAPKRSIARRLAQRLLGRR